jgi:hypothetical protein
MSALALDSTVMSSLISAFVGGALVAMVNHYYTRRRERERGDELLSAKFVDLRLAPYTELMKALAVVSTDRMRTVPPDRQRDIAAEVAALLHGAIYGAVGLVASTGTREVILCARSRCARFAAGDCPLDSMMDAVWAIHQMLRSDLNHRQDNVQREIDHIRASHQGMQAKQEAIERVIATMPHVRWPRAGAALRSPDATG